MLIISQNKERTTRFENLKSIFIINNCMGDGHTTGIFCDDKIMLGVYKTKERAMKLLLEISNFDATGAKVYEMPKE